METTVSINIVMQLPNDDYIDVTKRNIGRTFLCSLMYGADTDPQVRPRSAMAETRETRRAC